MQRRTIILWSATLLAAVVAALLVTALTAKEIEEPWNIVVVSQLFWLLSLTFIVALAHAIGLGLPLFLFLRSKSRIGIIACALGGFAVGALGPAVFELLGMLGGGSYNAWTGGRATVVNGIPTLTGWLEFALNVGVTGLIGLAGGLAFWLTMRLPGQIPASPEAAERPDRISPAISRAIAATAISSTCAVLLLPSIIKDNSCHNLFRDGPQSSHLQIYADVALTHGDWPALTQIFTNFAIAHSLSLRSDQQIRRREILSRSLDLCNEAGVSINILDNLWLDRSLNAPARIKGIKFRVDEFKAGSDWNLLAHELVDKINATWPGEIVYRGRGGETLSETEAFKGHQ
jgi:hypothetical protein